MYTYFPYLVAPVHTCGTGYGIAMGQSFKHCTCTHTIHGPNTTGIPVPMTNPSILTHCHCELMHGALTKLLDNNFVKAYHHRFTMECLDGVWHRFYLLIQWTILKSSFFYISSSAQAHIITLIRALLETMETSHAPDAQLRKVIFLSLDMSAISKFVCWGLKHTYRV